MRLVTSKNRVNTKNTWHRLFQNTVFWFNLKLAQQRGLQFYQTRSNAVILYDTLFAEFIEKAICMKTKHQLYQRESVILRPRVVLKATSQSGLHDLLLQEARSSWESEHEMRSATGKPEATLLTTEYLGKSISTVKLQDARRQNNVTKGDRDVRETSAQGTILERHEWKAGDQQNQRGTTQNCSSTWTIQRSSNFVRILQNFNVLIAIFFFKKKKKRDHLLQLLEKFWSTSGMSYNNPEG